MACSMSPPRRSAKRITLTFSVSSVVYARYSSRETSVAYTAELLVWVRLAVTLKFTSEVWLVLSIEMSEMIVVELLDAPGRNNE